MAGIGFQDIFEFCGVWLPTELAIVDIMPGAEYWSDDTRPYYWAEEGQVIYDVQPRSMSMDEIDDLTYSFMDIMQDDELLQTFIFTEVTAGGLDIQASQVSVNEYVDAHRNRKVPVGKAGQCRINTSGVAKGFYEMSGFGVTSFGRQLRRGLYLEVK